MCNKLAVPASSTGQMSTAEIPVSPLPQLHIWKFQQRNQRLN